MVFILPFRCSIFDANDASGRCELKTRAGSMAWRQRVGSKGGREGIGCVKFILLPLAGWMDGLGGAVSEACGTMAVTWVPGIGDSVDHALKELWRGVSCFFFRGVEK